MLCDPQFPAFISARGHIIKVLLFRSLFETYSKLTLSNLTDRSVAISGLESRLARAFETEGRYGTFHRYLQRSILWQRATDSGNGTDRMKRISGHKVPSWSWMVYKGGISYVDIPFEAVEWSNAVRCFPDISKKT